MGHQRSAILKQVLAQRIQAVTTAGRLVKDSSVKILDKEKIVGGRSY